MIRGVKGMLAVVALAAVGLGLRWMTAGSISGVNTYDLESMTVLAIGTVAWMAYGWLVLAVVLTVLEQLPGVLGALTGIIARRITSTAARTLLRSSLGVAAVTPLTVAVAHATPGDGHTSPQTEPRSTVQLTTTTNWRATEPASTGRIGATHLTGQLDPARTRQADAPSRSTDWRATEPRSTVRLTEQPPRRLHAPTPHTRAAVPHRPSPTDSQTRAAQPKPSNRRTDEPNPRTRVAQPKPPSERTDSPDSQTPSAAPEQSTGRTDTASPRGRVVGPAASRGRSDVPRSRGRMAVPDRPAVGAATRYTDLRSGVAGRVVVKAGDSLWSLAARELGPGASAAAVAARWPEWYAANRQVIGPDPDLILPGQVLHIPAAATSQHVPPTHQEK
ncbi:LysM peptidoglycan-binding domain-containing protein [Kribbella sp. NPDC051952]|uniref:LysM peptidoglycan-binding domain-containing protein n=1 Tax=Kribbella sp. NPDC051952 TaxID=3154851 RepID=UPI0034396DDB